MRELGSFEVARAHSDGYRALRRGGLEALDAAAYGQGSFVVMLQEQQW